MLTFVKKAKLLRILSKYVTIHLWSPCKHKQAFNFTDDIFIFEELRTAICYKKSEITVGIILLFQRNMDGYLSKQSFQLNGNSLQRRLLVPSLLKMAVFFVLLTMNEQTCLSTGLSKCPGTYCGRTIIAGSLKNVTQCGKCPRGYRTDGKICLKCNSSLSLYDWLYLGFMVFLVPVVNCHFINYFERKRAIVFLLHLMAIAEGFISIFVAVLVMEPTGNLSMNSCGVHSIKDWYTVFYDPTPDYVHKLRCTQEAVYPLYTIVFIYHAGCLLLLLTFRQLLVHFLKGISGRSSTYASMYFLPIVSVVHAIFSGVIYYSYPYLLLVASSIGTALYLSKTAESWKKTLSRAEPLIILLTYCLGNAYGMISITQFQYLVRDSILLLLVFLPTLFYFLTHRLTDPDRFS